MGASWYMVGVVVATTTATYLTAIAMVRLAGRRTVAQLSAFDAVVTIALGSLLATTAVSDSTTYLEGATAFATLLLLQVIVAWARRRVGALRRLLEFEPEIVVRNGDTELPGGLGTSQLSDAELRSLLREKGFFDTSDVVLAVLEPTGSLSVQRLGDERALIDRRRD